MSSYYWNPIGHSYSYYFSGSYDGGGFTISGLYTRSGSTSDYSYQGLFGFSYDDYWSSNKLTIHDVNITDSLLQGYENVGGIIGYVDHGVEENFLTIYNCSYSGIISATRNIGGIIGYVELNDLVSSDTSGALIYNCTNFGNIQGQYTSIGGIAGLYAGDIFNCFNTGEIRGG